MDWLKTIIDPGTLGGWARAATASILTALVGVFALKVPFLAKIITPDAVVYLSVAVGTFVTGLLSQKSKA